MKLIADSGSTKTSWYVMSEPDTPVHEFAFGGPGINPVRDDEDVICTLLARVRQDLESKSQSGRNSFAVTAIRTVHFYGAGCLPSTIPLMERLLSDFFPGACVHVASDMLGAARALCGRTEGIACILGTGSNSCLYDGCNIVANVPALGWILGDEGSGAVLGRTLVSDLLKGQLSATLRDAFLAEYGLTQDAIIQRVYRGEQPNRWLASLVPFLAAHRADAAIHDLLLSAFHRFLSRNVAAYGRRDLPVGFVGGVASEFESELRAAVAAEGLLMGQILKEPVSGMVCYHREG